MAFDSFACGNDADVDVANQGLLDLFQTPTQNGANVLEAPVACLNFYY